VTETNLGACGREVLVPADFSEFSEIEITMSNLDSPGPLAQLRRCDQPSFDDPGNALS
jgi:hypothetical protein